MTGAKNERRLTTVLAADVAGYSRLMGEDEAGTLTTLLKRRRDVLEPLFAEFGGRLVKLMGDGVLAEFSSVVNAVQCAIDFQNNMESLNAGLAETKRMRFRIGINLGDVIVDEGDLYGEGV